MTLLHSSPAPSPVSPGRRRFAGLLLGTLAGPLFGQSPGGNAVAGRRLDFEIAGDFGDASPEDIRAVLGSAADSIWRHCPSARWEVPGFHLYRSEGSPITVFHHRPDGRISIGVTTRGTFWSQFAFQFAHEFCHALAGHSNNWKEKQDWIRKPKANHWLEECLCETASLFALRAMGKSWKTAPPYPNWKDYGKSLTQYAAERLEATAKALPEGFGFRTWFVEHEGPMRKNPTQRELNNVVARELLPVFESAPGTWEAVTFYHATRRGPDQSLKERLADWHQAVPAVHRPAIRRIAAIFGVAAREVLPTS